MAQNARLGKFEAAVSAIRAEMDTDLTLQQLHLILVVGLEDGITMPDAAVRVRYSAASVSRNAKKLGRYADPSSHEIVGADLIEVRPDYYDRRRFMMTLTPRGRKLMNEISNAIGGHA